MARVFDRVLTGLHIPAMICALSIIAVILFGGFIGLNTRVGRILGAYIVWMGCISPLSSWRYGSLHYAWEFFAFWLVLFLAVAAGPAVPKALSMMFSVLAVACFLSIAWASHTGFMQGDRLSGNDVTYGNSDDFALLIGFAIPFWIFFAMERKNVFIRLALLVGGGLFLIRTLVSTGTRCAVLGLGVMLLVLFMRVQVPKRMMMIAGTAVAGIIIAATIPAGVLARLGTITHIFNSQQMAAEAMHSEAMESAMERQDLLFDAVKMAVTHPLFGVGPGQYVNYRFSSLHKKWFPAHNTYLQVAAECGIVGGVLYVFFLWNIHKTIRIVRKLNFRNSHPNWQMFDRMALCLELSLVFFAFCAAFLNCDRYPHQFILAGLAVALERLTRSELARFSGDPSLPAPPAHSFAPAIRNYTIKGPVQAARLSGVKR